MKTWQQWLNEELSDDERSKTNVQVDIIDPQSGEPTKLSVTLYYDPDTQKIQHISRVTVFATKGMSDYDIAVNDPIVQKHLPQIEDKLKKYLSRYQ